MESEREQYGRVIMVLVMTPPPNDEDAPGASTRGRNESEEVRKNEISTRHAAQKKIKNKKERT